MVNYTERGAGVAPCMNRRAGPEPAERVGAAAGEELWVREREGTAASSSFHVPLAFLKFCWEVVMALPEPEPGRVGCRERPGKALWGPRKRPARSENHSGSAVAPGEITAPIASGTLSLLLTIVCGQ
ncbi:hypothetical protein Nmel_014715 [Mimus melanotis]